MTRKSKFYDIVPKENKSIRNIPIPDKNQTEREYEDNAHIHHKKNSVKKHNHQESSSVEIKKLSKPITNVEEYEKDEYIEIIDHKISDDEIVEETHLLNENREEIENTKIPSLTEDSDFEGYTKKNTNGNRGIGSGVIFGSYRFSIAVIIILVLVFFTLNLFASGTVVVKTDAVKAPLESGYKFDKGDGETLQATSSIEIRIPATGVVHLEKYAKGSVVIFNNTFASQKLTKGTRIQSSNGLIYKLDAAVTVPAKKTVSGKPILGSVTTTFTAEAIGEKYNSGPKDFTLPGFKGTAKYETIYGRSKGGISGGYSGEVPNISQNDLANKIATAKEEIKPVLNKILKQLAATRGLIIDNDTLTYKIINSEPKISADKKEAVVIINGDLQAKTLLNASIDEASRSVLGLEDSTVFKYKVNLASSSLDISTGADNQMSVSGQAILSLSIDALELSKMLENKTKKEALSILQQTKGVAYVQIKTFPFWKGSLPSYNRIKVLVQ